MDSLEIERNGVSDGSIDLINLSGFSSDSNGGKATKTFLDKSNRNEALPSGSPHVHQPDNNGSLWLEGRMNGMQMIMDEDFGFAHPELNDFLTLSCDSPTDGTGTSSSDSSFASSFNDSISEPTPDTNCTAKDKDNECIEESTKSEVCTPEGESEKQVELPLSEPETKTEVKTANHTHPRASKLPTPLQRLKNCSTFTRSPVRYSQIEELKETRSLVDDTHSSITKLLKHSNENSRQLDEKSDSHPSSGRSSSNDTYVVSRSSSEERTTDFLNDSLTSDVSSVGSTVSTEKMPSNRGLKLPKASSRSISTRPVIKSKLVKPQTKTFLLPSKTLNKKDAPTKSSLLRRPQSKDTTRRLLKPSSAISKTSKLNFNKENGGVPRMISRPVAPVTKKRQYPSGGHLRKSSIPKPTALSDLRKNYQQVTKESALGNKPIKSTKHIESSVTVIQSTTLGTSVVGGDTTNSTPSRRRPQANDTLAQSVLADTTPGMRPLHSLSSVEGESQDKNMADAPVKNSLGMRSASEEGSVMKTPRTITKRRSFIPTPGGIEKTVPIPFNLSTTENYSTDSQISSKQSMLPPKRQLNPKVKSSGLQRNLRAGAVRGRMAFKPRNGQVDRVKNDGPFKAKPFSYGDDLEMVPKFGGSKVVHSPVNKEDAPATPHSKWSPIRKKRDYDAEDACFQCTKKIQ